ncbi:ATP-binding protein [Kitasatospora sp. NPDC058046]|uniref:nSTAND1 domain-containing NTPase n=1 Tax=Kitasatospora sp. NPDC058046 TaxID=3346312 RepID=UPI0036DA6320
MPRRESPLDPGDGPLLRFAGDLRALRERAGRPPYRQLALRAHCSAASLSVAAGGRRLPSLAVTLAYVQACGGDVREWRHRWQLLAAELAAEQCARRRAQDVGRAPYPGAAAFEAADAERFFGREALLDRLVALVAERRLVIVSGPSGAGKSSLVRAGLLARLGAPAATGAVTGATTGRPGAGGGAGRPPADGGVPVALLTPGERPMEAYALALARLGQRAGETRRGGSGPTAGDPVLVVDQAEQLRTRCRDAAERARFLDALVATAAGDPDGASDGLPVAAPARCRVVLVVRSDQCGPLLAEHPGLAEAGRHGVLPVGRPAPDELRRAITEPALRSGCTVEGALLAVLISTAAQQPGALPLLSAALLETWRRRSGNALTLAGFQATGGFEGALARTAEALYNGLDAPDQARARAVFLRLGGELLGAGEDAAGVPAALGDGLAPGGGPLPGGELVPGGDEGTRKPARRAEFDDPGVPEVMERLVRARLVVVDRDTVELSHQALPQAWPRLRDWLAEGREALGEQCRLTAAARGWAAADQDPELLYRGVRLEELVRRVAAGELAAAGVERAFLAASSRAAVADRRRAQRQNLAVAGVAAAGGALLALAGGSRIRRAWRW